MYMELCKKQYNNHLVLKIRFKTSYLGDNLPEIQIQELPS